MTCKIDVIVAAAFINSINLLSDDLLIIELHIYSINWSEFQKHIYHCDWISKQIEIMLYGVITYMIR